MAEYKLLKTEGRAKRAEFHTVHGTIQTPVFMNVGTIGAIKGAVSTMDLQQIGTQVELSNTYHLHVRPGDKIVKQLGGLHKFMVWDKDQGRRRNFPFPHRWSQDLHGTGREYADPVQSCLHYCHGI